MFKYTTYSDKLPVQMLNSKYILIKRNLSRRKILYNKLYTYTSVIIGLGLQKQNVLLHRFVRTYYYYNYSINERRFASHV